MPNGALIPASARILIVDDTHAMRMVIQKKLAEIGLTRTYEAYDGENALQILSEQEQKGEPIQLICSDWSMPTMSGIEFLRQVRAQERYRELPFLMVTAECEDKSMEEARRLGVSGFVSKPFTSERFFKALGEVWNKHLR